MDSVIFLVKLPLFGMLAHRRPLYKRSERSTIKLRSTPVLEHSDEVAASAGLKFGHVASYAEVSIIGFKVLVMPSIV